MTNAKETGMEPSLVELMAEVNQEVSKSTKQGRRRYTPNGMDSTAVRRARRKMRNNRQYDCEHLLPGEIDFYVIERGFGFINYEGGRLYFHAKGYRQPVIVDDRIVLNPNSDPITCDVEEQLSSGKQVLFFRSDTTSKDKNKGEHFALVWCLSEVYYQARQAMATIPVYRLIRIDYRYPEGQPEKYREVKRETWKGTEMADLSIHLRRSPLETAEPRTILGDNDQQEVYVDTQEWKFQCLTAGQWIDCDNPLLQEQSFES